MSDIVAYYFGGNVEFLDGTQKMLDRDIAMKLDFLIKWYIDNPDKVRRKDKSFTIAYEMRKHMQ